MTDSSVDQEAGTETGFGVQRLGKRATQLAAIIGLAVALIGSPVASAATPTRIVDHTRSIVCTGTSEGVEITVAAESSELAGTASYVDLSDPATGEFSAAGFAGSDWTDRGVRTTIPVTDRDDQPAGEVYFSASYRPVGERNTVTSKFKDGNIRVVEEHTETLFDVTDVVLTYGDVRFSDLRCDGSTVDGSLFFTNPAVHVSFSTGLIYECTATNLRSWYIDGPLDDLFVDVEYADVPGAEASGIVPAAEGTSWQGEFRLQISDESAGNVGVTATLGRSGRPLHLTEGTTGMRNHAQRTPYPFHLEIQGPGAPASLDCTLYDLRFTWRTPNQAG